MNYNFENLPEVWGVDLHEEHPRKEEFMELFNSNLLSKYKSDYGFTKRFYGFKLGERYYSNEPHIFNGQIMPLNTFFALIDPIRLEVGNWVYCLDIHMDGIYKYSIGETYEIVEYDKELNNYLIKDNCGAISPFNRIDFRNATPEEIAQVENNTISKANSTPEWIPKQGDMVLMSDDEINWHKKVFLCQLPKNYGYLADLGEMDKISYWKYVKPYEAPDELKQRLDELVKDYAEQRAKRLVTTFEDLP